VTLIIGALLMLGGCVSTPSASSEATLYHNLTLLDPVTERRTEDAFVVVEDGRIVRVGRGRLPRGFGAENRRDMGGAFALPGLIDTHAHITLGPLAVAVRDGVSHLSAFTNDEIVAHNARMMIAHGITTIRNPGGASEANFSYARRVGAGELLGPDAYSAGEVLDAEIAIGGLASIVSDTTSIEAEVARQAALGVDYIKLYQSLTEEQLSAAINAANAHGLETILHAGDVSWTRAARLGVDSLVHAMPVSPDLLNAHMRGDYSPRGGAFTFFEWWERVDLDGPEIREMITELAERRISIDLTLVVFQKAFWGNDAAVRDAGIEFAHPAMVNNWRRVFRFDAGWSAQDYERAQAVWPKVLRFARMLYEAGVPLTIGDDFANPFVAPGADMHAEMRLYHEAGIPPWAILRMATSDAAQSLRLEGDLGRIARGLQADIVFLDQDPSLDIVDISAVRSVVTNGAYVDAEALR
jgi:imidazolonepropionase-like amidohydrolase